jgi:dimethyladenosine transferase 1
MSISRIPPLPTIADILRMYNIRAKKQLSQNFIMDPRLLKRIAEKCGNLEGKYVVEVGPGPGGITRAILGLGAWRCAVVEKDPRFMSSLNHLNLNSGNRLDIHLGDVLSFNMENLFPDGLRVGWEAEVPDIRVVGNLPFNVSTPLIIKWLRAMSTKSNIFSYGRVPLVLTFQHEVAHRIIAAPGDPERCRLSVVCQNWARVNYEFMIPAGAFTPAPKVEVGLVSFNPLSKPYIDLPFPLVNTVVSALFSGKRKNLANTAKYLFPRKLENDLGPELLGLANISPTTSAIYLGMDDFNRLCHAYKYLMELNPTLAGYTRNITPESSREILIEPPTSRSIQSL